MRYYIRSLNAITSELPRGPENYSSLYELYRGGVENDVQHNLPQCLNSSCFSQTNSFRSHFATSPKHSDNFELTRKLQ